VSTSDVLPTRAIVPSAGQRGVSNFDCASRTFNYQGLIVDSPRRQSWSKPGGSGQILVQPLQLTAL
jgi:hypothetical protein